MNTYRVKQNINYRGEHKKMGEIINTEENLSRYGDYVELLSGNKIKTNNSNLKYSKEED
jgi:hypothetical protein